jgi:SAM-dependent methyltransferase
MTQRDAIALIDHPILRAVSPTHWADLGCGSGTFTLALAALLPPGSTIEAIDLRPGVDRQTTPAGVTIIPRSADFVADDLGLTGLDGILMANSLHYVRDKATLLKKLRAYYRAGVPASGMPPFGAPAPGATPVAASAATDGSLLIVEYDTDRPTPHWVPYPLSFASAAKLLHAAGWLHIQKLGSRPSEYFVGAASPRSSSSELRPCHRQGLVRRLVPAFASLGNRRNELYAALAT